MMQVTCVSDFILVVTVMVMVCAHQRQKPVISCGYDDFKIEISTPKHAIENVGGSGTVGTANQVSVGVKTSDLVAVAAKPTEDTTGVKTNTTEVKTRDLVGVASENETTEDPIALIKLILANGWYHPSLSDELKDKEKKTGVVYALIASAIEFFDTIKDNYLHSKNKDSWKVLPRTPVWAYLSSHPTRAEDSHGQAAREIRQATHHGSLQCHKKPTKPCCTSHPTMHHKRRASKCVRVPLRSRATPQVPIRVYSSDLDPWTRPANKFIDAEEVKANAITVDFISREASSAVNNFKDKLTAKGLPTDSRQGAEPHEWD